MDRNTRPPRRPAIIEPETLEYLEGEEDPALSSQAAHTTARALVSAPGGQWTDPEPLVRERLVQVAGQDGVDALAELWATSPALTLPGALWRLTLIHYWAGRDPQTLRERHAAGLAAPQLGALIDPAGAKELDLDRLLADIAQVLSGRFTADFAELLERAQAELRILAAGATPTEAWISDASDALAHAVTTRPSALLSTADELDGAAVLFREGRLD